MSYRLSSPSHTHEKIKQIVQECMDNAAAQLKQRQVSEELHEGIHEARKRFKEIRAVLRLVRTELGASYDQENPWFRDQARRLAALRDAKAMLESCAKLSATFSAHLEHDPFPALHLKLEKSLLIALDQHPRLDEELSVLRKALNTAQARVDTWPLEDKGFGLLEQGLLKSYRAGRGAYQKCHQNPKTADFHAWRKRVKEHGYHTQLLLEAWPGELNGREAALKKLADLLGDDHDLVVLKQQIKDAPDDFGTPEDVERLLHLLDRRQQQLHTHALALGGRLYAEKPAAHLRRLATYWACWREEEKNL